MITSNLLVYILLVPTAALLLANVVTDFPHSYLASTKAFGIFETEQRPLLNEATLSAIPSLAILLAALSAAHLRIAWLVLERDWARVAALGTLLAAMTVTLILFSIVVFGCFALPLSQAGALAIELTTISALARWHMRSLGGSLDGAIRRI